jgi:hypothetical protein
LQHTSTLESNNLPLLLQHHFFVSCSISSEIFSIMVCFVSAKGWVLLFGVEAIVFLLNLLLKRGCCQGSFKTHTGFYHYFPQPETGAHDFLTGDFFLGLGCFLK